MQNSASQIDQVLRFQQSFWRRSLASFCSFVLRLFYDLQDVILAVRLVRSFVLYALGPRCQATVLRSLAGPDSQRESFQQLKYYLASDAKELLLHASFHAFAWRPASLSKYFGRLPPVGRILLQSSSENSQKYQEAVAAALAKEVGASFLVLDNELLTSIFRQAMGSGSSLASEPSENIDPGGGAILPFLLSFWLSGGRIAFVYEVIRRACLTVKGPLLVFIKDADTTVCGNWDRYDAFVDSFGSCHAAGEPTDDLVGPVRHHTVPFMLVGGTALGDSGAHLTQGSSSQGEQDTESKPGGTPAGPDDALPGIIPSAADLGLSMVDDRPSARKLLPRLFMTRVRLTAPSEGAQAVAHRQQLQADAQDLMAERNHRHASSFATRRGSIPPVSSEVYRQKALSRRDWGRVMAWANCMEAAFKTQEGHTALEKIAQETATDQQADPTDAAALQKQSQHKPQNNHQQQSMTVLEQAQLLARRFKGLAAKIVLNGILPEEDAAAAGESKEEKNGEKGRKKKPIAALTRQLRGLVARSLEDSNELQLPEHESKEPMSGGMKELLAFSKKLTEMKTSEEAIWYGLRMLDQSGGSLRSRIKADNQYERRLLSEVVRPEDAGSGFAEVGALAEAKDALREAVQLPLQHPHIFAKGTLASHCKGVLLFGPPGTGKTLLARAVAAECGASFLTISPSTVASKWLGDGVRSVRAIFSLAAKLSPCVLFVDEVDAILSRRSSRTEHEAMREIKNEFMQNWDGLRTAQGNQRIVVLGASNRPMDLDEAVLRRFARRIFCDLPKRPARAAILEVILAGEKLADDVSLEHLANRTEGFSGSDLRSLCSTAAMRPVRDLLKATGRSAQVAKPAQPKHMAPSAAAVDSSRPAASTSALQSQSSAAPSHDASALDAAPANAEQSRSSPPEASSASDPSNPPHHYQPTSAPAADTSAAFTSNPDPQQASLTLSVSEDGSVQAGIAASHNPSKAQHQQDSAEAAEAEPNVGDILQAGLMLAETAMEEQEASPSPPDIDHSSSSRPEPDSSAQDKAHGSVGQHAAQSSASDGNAGAEASHSSQTSTTSHAETGEGAAGPKDRQAAFVSASMQQPQAGGTSNGDAAQPEDATGAGAKKARHRGMQLVTRLDEEGRRIAQAANVQAKVVLRPITAQDFEEALKKVVASVSEDNSVMSDLRQWHSQYGEGSERAGFNPKLSYFI